MMNRWNHVSADQMLAASRTNLAVVLNTPLLVSAVHLWTLMLDLKKHGKKDQSSSHGVRE